MYVITTKPCYHREPVKLNSLINDPVLETTLCHTQEIIQLFVQQSVHANNKNIKLYITVFKGNKLVTSEFPFFKANNMKGVPMLWS